MVPSIVIRACEIADARGPRPERSDILVRDGSIAAIRATDRSRDRLDAPIEVDAAGCTVVPGLINMHEHLGVIHPGTSEEREFAGETRDGCLERMMRNADYALHAGVTGMRLVGERDGLDLELRDLIETGRRVGPRIWTGGQPLDYLGGGRGFVGALECGSPEAFGRAASAQLERGADFVKVMLTGSVTAADPGAVGLSRDDFEAVRLAARAAGAKIAVHTAAAREPIVDALVEEGVDSLEHCYLMDTVLLRRAVANNVLLVLTPLVCRCPDYLAELGVPGPTIERMSEAGEAHWRTVCAAVRSNARIALGTDINSHAMIAGTTAPVRELEVYEEAGATPATLLAIAGRNGAVWLDEADRLGLVEEGFFADLLLLEENPLTVGATAYRRMREVIARGVRVQPG